MRMEPASVDHRGELAPLDWEYVPSREAADLVEIQPRYGLFIDGEFTEPASGDWFPTINPATEETLAEVARADATDVDRAVTAARAAFTSWSKTDPAERAKILFRIARMIQERSREFAVLETLDGGKPIKESRDVDLPLVAAHFFYYAGWADKLEYAFPGLRPRPVGVAGQVIPWNFPLLMLAWKVAPALATGNTVLLKPAETTPLSALHFAALAVEAGLPPGVLNIVTGAGDTGEAVVTHPEVDKVAFTGSTEVGKLIQRRLAGTGKRLTLELGGKGAHIIFEDAPVDQAIEGVINGIFFNQGHVCCAGSRLFIQESIAEPFLEKLKARLRTLRVGDPLDKNTDVGAINSAAQLAKIEELVRSGSRGGRRAVPTGLSPARPGVLVPAHPVHRGVAEPPDRPGGDLRARPCRCSPSAPPDEAVEKANNTPYGLAAGVWTSKGSRILWMADRIRSGVVWANTYIRFDPELPVRRVQGVGLRPGGGTSRAASLSGDAPMSRLDVRKTYKLYIGGEFPRSESGRSYPVARPDGTVAARVARASRKDLRDAVRAARRAFPWMGGPHRLQPWPDPLPGGRDGGGPRGDLRRPAPGVRRWPAGRPGGGDPQHRPSRLVRRMV
ncbi:MAG: betaine-aldehyde dehydrogenase [Acidimicrobiia bacterium]|nr:MAG: betaine-aldehyde dehydrogenase [Acidimicrobiia bacterium]